MLLMALFILALFTIIPTKLPTYIVPISPALAILVSIYLQGLLRRKQRLILLTLAALVLVTTAAGTVVLARVLGIGQGSDPYVILLNVLFSIAGVIIVLGELVSLVLLQQRLLDELWWCFSLEYI